MCILKRDVQVPPSQKPPIMQVTQDVINDLQFLSGWLTIVGCAYWALQSKCCKKKWDWPAKSGKNTDPEKKLNAIIDEYPQKSYKRHFRGSLSPLDRKYQVEGIYGSLRRVWKNINSAYSVLSDTCPDKREPIEKYRYRSAACEQSRPSSYTQKTRCCHVEAHRWLTKWRGTLKRNNRHASILFLLMHSNI